jgi:hypothetical protein
MLKKVIPYTCIGLVLFAFLGARKKLCPSLQAN